MKSVLQDWVMELPLREQGVLLTAVRGCDLVPKYPLDAPERQLVAYIRGAFLNPADPREVDSQPGTFMSHNAPIDFKPSCVGHYPLHWVMHIVHALEVLGYRHPEPAESYRCQMLYIDFCVSFHLPSEGKQAMIKRLSEDRIVKGNIVS